MSAVMGKQVGSGTDRIRSGISEGPVLTEEGRRLLEARVHRLREEILPELADAMQDSEDDGREANEYGRALGELHRLIVILGQARVLEGLPGARHVPRRVQLGDEVELRFPEGAVERLRIVHPVEAPLDDHRISAESPLGVAVLGRRPGEEVLVGAPGAPYRCRLLRWDRRGSWRRLIAEVVRG